MKKLKPKLIKTLTPSNSYFGFEALMKCNFCGSIYNSFSLNSVFCWSKKCLKKGMKANKEMYKVKKDPTFKTATYKKNKDRTSFKNG